MRNLRILSRRCILNCCSGKLLLHDSCLLLRCHHRLLLRHHRLRHSLLRNWRLHGGSRTSSLLRLILLLNLLLIALHRCGRVSHLIAEALDSRHLLANLDRPGTRVRRRVAEALRRLLRSHRDVVTHAVRNASSIRIDSKDSLHHLVERRGRTLLGNREGPVEAVARSVGHGELDVAHRVAVIPELRRTLLAVLREVVRDRRVDPDYLSIEDQRVAILLRTVIVPGVAGTTAVEVQYTHETFLSLVVERIVQCVLFTTIRTP